MNTQDGSRYVFSGNQTSTPSFSPAGLPNPGDLTTNVATDYYGGDNGIAQATVDNNVNVQYGVTGNNPAFEQIVRVLNFFANDATPLSQTNPADVANVQQGQQMLAPGRAKRPAVGCDERRATGQSQPAQDGASERDNPGQHVAERHPTGRQRHCDHAAQYAANAAPGILPDDQRPAVAQPLELF